MIGMYFNKYKIYLDANKFNKDLEKSAERATRRAAKAFVRTLKNLLPTYTGRAQGSLAAFGQELGIHWTITPARDSRNHKIKSQFQRGLQESVFGIENKNGRIRFYFRSDVWYVNINELKSYPAIKLINKAPWHYFDKAMDAANRVFSYETKNMPDL